jgi:uncharacterized protein
MVEIELIKLKEFNLNNAVIVEGFPSVGLISPIVTNYLIGTLNLDQICALDSRDFPPISMIYAAKPKFPARIYGSEKLKLCVFLSEFSPSPKLARPLASTITSFASTNKCSLIISPEGIPASLEEIKKEKVVWGVGSTPGCRERLSQCQIPQLNRGIISGVSGVLLNEGRKQGFDVICLLIKAGPQLMDAMAAAKIVEAIDKLLPQIKIDVKPLYKRAKQIEEQLRKLRVQAKPAEPEEVSPMYR